MNPEALPAPSRPRCCRTHSLHATLPEDTSDLAEADDAEVFETLIDELQQAGAKVVHLKKVKQAVAEMVAKLAPTRDSLAAARTMTEASASEANVAAEEELATTVASRISGKKYAAFLVILGLAPPAATTPHTPPCHAKTYTHPHTRTRLVTRSLNTLGPVPGPNHHPAPGGAE